MSEVIVDLGLVHWCLSVRLFGLDKCLQRGKMEETMNAVLGGYQAAYGQPAFS